MFLTSQSNLSVPFHLHLWLIFTPASDLIPPSALISPFVPTYPVEPSPDTTQPVNQFLSEAQLQLVSVITPSGSLHKTDYDVVSLDQEQECSDCARPGFRRVLVLASAFIRLLFTCQHQL